MDSKVGLIIQLAGVLLITLLTLFLRRSLNVPALRHWTNAWLLLSCGLFCLRLAFTYDEYSTVLFSFYFLCEYLFAFLLIAGCKGLKDNAELKMKHEIVVMPLVVLAFALPFLAEDFNLIFNLHSLILAGLFFVSFATMLRTRIRSFGGKVMLIALGLLTLNFLHYFVIFTARKYIDFSTAYLSYNSIVDLTLQILLGFGMVIVLLEIVLSEVQTANAKLREAHKKLEEIAHVDPLTTALNRHAFHGYLKRKNDHGDRVTGCIGFFDVDDLKDINDAHGHGVGDAAIRMVSRAIREIIRGDDLLFRWGGDEFFVIMIGLDAESAYQRIPRMERGLANVMLDGAPYPMTLTVSHAFQNFASLSELETTIAKADANMYLQKQGRKEQREGMSITPGATAADIIDSLH